MNEKLDFSGSDSGLLKNLQTNRETALRHLIPTRMMNEFMNSVYPDQNLKSIVKDIYHSYHDHLTSEELRKMYLQNSLRLSLSVKGFGRRLILHHSIDPEDIVKIMLGHSKPASEEEM